MGVWGREDAPKKAVDLINNLFEFEVGVCWRKLQLKKKTINLEFGGGREGKEREREWKEGEGDRGREIGRGERVKRG